MTPNPLHSKSNGLSLSERIKLNPCFISSSTPSSNKGGGVFHSVVRSDSLQKSENWSKNWSTLRDQQAERIAVFHLACERILGKERFRTRRKKEKKRKENEKREETLLSNSGQRSPFSKVFLRTGTAPSSPR